MRKILFLLISLLSITLHAQKIHTKEIKEPNGDGLIIFNIITDDIKIKFNKDLYYHWYNEFSGMQGSFGAAGGKLLHGRYSEFDENGRLKYQCYLKFGLSDSTELIFGESGLIISKNVYKNGIEIYSSGSWGNGDKYEIFSSEDKPNISTEDISNTIKIEKTESGLIEVPVVLNDVLRINFIFDSGASEVSLSPDVALTLMRTGTISESDWLQDQIYTFADGSKAKSKRFLIKKLVIGNQTLTNIEASISKSIEAPMLIGQNVMNKLGSVTIDYENLLLIIKNK